MRILIVEITNHTRVINDIAYELDAETNGEYDSVMKLNVKDVPNTYTLLPESESPMKINIGEFVYIGGGAVKVLSREDVEKIQKIQD